MSESYSSNGDSYSYSESGSDGGEGSNSGSSSYSGSDRSGSDSETDQSRGDSSSSGGSESGSDSSSKVSKKKGKGSKKKGSGSKSNDKSKIKMKESDSESKGGNSKKRANNQPRISLDALSSTISLAVAEHTSLTIATINDSEEGSGFYITVTSTDSTGEHIAGLSILNNVCSIRQLPAQGSLNLSPSQQTMPPPMNNIPPSQLVVEEPGPAPLSVQRQEQNLESVQSLYRFRPTGGYNGITGQMMFGGGPRGVIDMK